MIVMAASKERKRQETEMQRPNLKEKLSQTGWKIRHNFLKRTNAHLDDRERIDVFGGKDQPGLTQGPTLGTPIDVREGGDMSGDSDDCMILEYGA